MAYSGKYRPRFPKKYKGDASKIVYRSSWEARCMNYFDLNENVLWWASEEVIIPYKSPIDGRYHRYYPDFVINVRQRDGKTKTLMIEVKPENQKNAPKVRARQTKKYINEVVTYAVNQAKWDAATEYCNDRMWEFKVLTEKDMGINS
jgi:hypothetical protein